MKIPADGVESEFEWPCGAGETQASGVLVVLGGLEAAGLLLAAGDSTLGNC